MRIQYAILALVLVAGTASAETIMLKTSLDGPTESPPVMSEGKGTATVSLDTVAKTVTYTVEYTGLTGPATAAHIHGPAAHGANAGVVVPLTTSASPLKGEATLTDAQITDLLDGKDYINIHTSAHPGGEIRGYLTK